MSAADDILFAPIGATTDIKVPDAWLEVLTYIRSQDGWSTSTLAGGALRDLENGRAIKDVDIFVPYLGDNAGARRRLKGGSIHSVVVEMEHNSHNASQLGREGISHFNFEKDGWKFEISQHVDAFDYDTLLDAFDIGLCMISVDGLNRINRTPEYKRDVADKNITIIRKTGGREMEHAQRLQKKYAGWTIIPL